MTYFTWFCIEYAWNMPYGRAVFTPKWFKEVVPMGLGNVHSKISREFSLRLDRLRPRDKVRAILMLRAETNSGGGAGGRRPSRDDRQDAAKKLSQLAEAALPEIDQILERFDG